MSTLHETMVEYGSLVFPDEGKNKGQKCIIPIRDRNTYDGLRIYGKRKSAKAKDVYVDWFESYKEAQEFVKDARNC